MLDNHYIFDVDGTLTPSRQSIVPVFAEFFLEFCKTHAVSLVSGSDFEKTQEQLGDEICNKVRYIFSCSGNDIRDRVNHVRQINTIPYIFPLRLRLLELLSASKFPIRTGNHIENRPGSVNFSIVGRNASLADRAKYIEFDKANDERKRLVQLLNEEFPELEASIGGETGIDIVAKGYNKAQIVRMFHKDTNLVFFGDSTAEGGNDYPLAKVIADKKLGIVNPVSSWEDTYRLLLKI